MADRPLGPGGPFRTFSVHFEHFELTDSNVMIIKIAHSAIFDIFFEIFLEMFLVETYKLER